MEIVVNIFYEANAMKKNPARNVHLKKGPTKLLENINLVRNIRSLYIYKSINYFKGNKLF